MFNGFVITYSNECINRKESTSFSPNEAVILPTPSLNFFALQPLKSSQMVIHLSHNWGFPSWIFTFEERLTPGFSSTLQFNRARSIAPCPLPFSTTMSPVIYVEVIWSLSGVSLDHKMVFHAEDLNRFIWQIVHNGQKRIPAASISISLVSVFSVIHSITSP